MAQASVFIIYHLLNTQQFGFKVHDITAALPVIYQNVIFVKFRVLQCQNQNNIVSFLATGSLCYIPYVYILYLMII